jgi:RNA methyltransferase, TrmH family
MTDFKPPRGDSPYKGPPSGPPRDKRERERDRRMSPADVPPPSTRPPPRDRPAFERPHETLVDEPPRAPAEQRLYGLNACLAMFAARPESLRKVWLLDSRIPKLKAVLAFCVKNRLGYTLVEAADLERLSGSAHHEGVVFGALPATEQALPGWLQALPRGPSVAIWLDGVGNPHNLGAILRSAAHFRVSGVLLPKDSTLALSGAAARVAEGGAEHVAMVRLGRSEGAIEQLQSAGFVLASTVVRGGKSLYSTALPARMVLLMGAEQTGVDAALTQASGLKLGIPGSGKVESLNVASATSVILGEWWRQHAEKPAG